MIKFSAPEDRVIRIGSKKVTERELEVLLLLRENPSYTNNELADKLHVSRKTVSGRIATLRNKGIIIRVGSDSKGHWQINNKNNCPEASGRAWRAEYCETVSASSCFH